MAHLVIECAIVCNGKGSLPSFLYIVQEIQHCRVPDTLNVLLLENRQQFSPYNHYNVVSGLNQTRDQKRNAKKGKVS